MTALASFCREIYYGTTKRALRTRYTFLLFDLVVISYFVVTTFLPSSEWIVVADMSIGVVLLLDFLGRLIADRNRGAFLIKPMTIVDLVVIEAGGRERQETVAHGGSVLGAGVIGEA